MKKENPTYTYQSRLEKDEEINEILQASASHLSQVKRSLFADLMAGRKVSDLKSQYLMKFQITARQFNACRVNVEEIIQSKKELQGKYILEIKQTIEALEKKIARLEKRAIHRSKVFWKKRKLNKLRQKLANLESDRLNGIVRVCFGTKNLFRAQFHLEESGYPSFAKWKKDWEQSRNNSFFLLGSKDETAGNQSCVATIQTNGKLTLRIRLPEAIGHGKYLTLTDVYFPYGHEKIIESLNDSLVRNALQHCLANVPRFV